MKLEGVNKATLRLLEKRMRELRRQGQEQEQEQEEFPVSNNYMDEPNPRIWKKNAEEREIDSLKTQASIFIQLHGDEAVFVEPNVGRRITRRARIAGQQVAMEMNAGFRVKKEGAYWRDFKNKAWEMPPLACRYCGKFKGKNFVLRAGKTYCLDCFKKTWGKKEEQNDRSNMSSLQV